MTIDIVSSKNSIESQTASFHLNFPATRRLICTTWLHFILGDVTHTLSILSTVSGQQAQMYSLYLLNG